MLTGKALLNELVDELNELKLSHMAVKRDGLYHSPNGCRGDRRQFVLRKRYKDPYSRFLTCFLRGACYILEDRIGVDVNILQVRVSLAFWEITFDTMVFRHSIMKRYIISQNNFANCSRI